MQLSGFWTSLVGNGFIFMALETGDVSKESANELGQMPVIISP